MSSPKPSAGRASKLPTDPLKVLRSVFGYRQFRPGQREAIDSLLAGHSTLALFPTGAGKSLCYQIPALMLPGTALVVSPLLALMKDQVDALQARGVAARRLDSTLTPEAREAVEAAFAAGTLRLLYLSPERFAHASFQALLRTVPISFLAVDEAHCVSEWGHDFRPDYLRLGPLAAAAGLTRVLALTATAAPRVAEDICRTFAIPAEGVVRTGSHRPNLRLAVHPLLPDKRAAWLAKQLSRPALRPAIVYVNRQETAEQIATHLAGTGLKARAYHAGLPGEFREEAQQAFMSGECEIMVATTAFGMGIDKADIRSVYHAGLPRSLENYVQETGRAGRDGRTSHCVLTGFSADRHHLENGIHAGLPTAAALRSVIDHLLRRGPQIRVSAWHLARQADIRRPVLDTLLAELELDGILVPQEARPTAWRVRFLHPDQSLAAGHPPADAAILHALFALRRWPKSQIVIADAAGLSEATNRTEEEIGEFLSALESGGDLQLQPRGMQTEYLVRTGTPEADPRAILARSQERIATRHARELERITAVLEYGNGNGCLTNRLLAAFGEALPGPCGHCAACLRPDKTPAFPAVPEPPALTDADISLMSDVHAERRPALRHPRQLTRFLCGFSSPAILRDRLTRHDAWAALSACAFNDVLTQAEAVTGLRDAD